MQDIAPSVIGYTEQIDLQNTNTLRKIFERMRPKLVKVHFSNQKERQTYSRSFYFFVWYFISGFVFIVLNIVVFSLSLCNLTGEKLKICIIFCVINIFVLWIFKLSSIFHLWGLNRFAYTIDNVVNAIFSPDGKINEFIYKKIVKFFLYIIDFFVFVLFFKYSNSIIRHYTDVDFLMEFFELAFYQYVLGTIITFCISKICWKKCKNNHRFKDFPTVHTYYNEIFKNTTYLVLLTLYIFNKYVQILSADGTYNINRIEAIGALFLLDTYFDKNKATDSYLLSQGEHLEDKSTK